jgi:hypothetical protein
LILALKSSKMLKKKKKKKQYPAFVHFKQRDWKLTTSNQMYFSDLENTFCDSIKMHFLTANSVNKIC